MTGIKAMRRTYGGVRFRSTLEADWAATLDSLGITWQYEPEAYETPLGIYSPDFWLPAQKVWLEVKGPHNERVDKAEAFANLLAVAHEQAASVGDQGRISAGEVSPVHRVLVFGLPSKEGRAELRSAACFTDVGLAECAQCRHWTLVFAYSPLVCRICLADHDPDMYERAAFGPAFRRARDDAPRTG